MNDQEKVERVMAILGHRISDGHLGHLWEALQLPGSGVFQIDGRAITEGNKRLAIVGDRALELASVMQWRLSGHARGNTIEIPAYLTQASDAKILTGDWTRHREQVLSNENLASVCGMHDLAASLILSRLNPGQTTSTIIRATLIEAICGAYYHDGMEVLQEVMGTLGLTYQVKSSNQNLPFPKLLGNAMQLTWFIPAPRRERLLFPFRKGHYRVERQLPCQVITST